MPNGDVIQDELFKATGQRTVPNIFIHQEHIGGVRIQQASLLFHVVSRFERATYC
jgi:glutaredoxin-related protein